MNHPSSNLPALALSAIVMIAAHAGADTGILVNDSIPEPLAHNFALPSYSLPNVHAVAFQQDGVVTYKGWQYATYYRGNTSDYTGLVGVARRSLPDGAWETMVLPDYIFSVRDSHNDVVIGICPGDGSIHLSFDHHVDALNYRVSIPGVADNPTTTAWTPALFGPVTDHLLPGGATMTSITYPRFIPTPDGKLLFHHRLGSSAAGNSYIYEYDGTTHEWSLVGKYISQTGTYIGPVGTSTSRNSYFDNNHFDANGRLHVTWCWREPGGGVANHDLLYAYSDDVGRTWKNQLGTTIAIAGTSFITLNSPGILGWPIPQYRNYINNSAMITDNEGRVHVVAWHLADGVPDNLVWDATIASGAVFNHYWRGTDGIWRKNETNFTGTRAKMVADDDGRLFLIYGDATNVRIAAATPAADPEATPADSWNDWAPLDLSGALPEGRALIVNTIIDPLRWKKDRILSVYAQETNITGTAPTPLHILDYHVSRAAAGPKPANEATYKGLNPTLTWHSGIGSDSSDLYFGTDQAAVAAATTASPEYLGRLTDSHHASDTLEILTTYYWRVDSVSAAGTVTPGRIWSFTVGDPQLIVSQPQAAREYGGRASFQADLLIDDDSVSAADLTLYLGTSDGGTDPAAWQQAIDLGAHPDGPVSVTLDALPAGSYYYRFLATTPYRNAWTPATATLGSDGDLSPWPKTALISFPGYTGAETLTDFPVLIRLSPATLPGFTYDQLLSPPHADLRFSTMDGSVLPHEIEQWDPSGTSLIWVRVPELSAATQLRVWWGKAGESPPATSADVWSGGFNGVWHLDPTLGFATDSSSSQLAATATATTTADGIIPGASGFDGSTSTVAIDDAPALNPLRVTLEAWVKTSATGIVSIFGKDQTGGPTYRVWQFRLNAGKPELIVFATATSKATATSPDAINDGEFHHVCGTWNGTTASIHVDGVLKVSVPFSGSLNPNQANQAFIGRMQTADPGYFTGTLDEVRLSSTARSTDWIVATYQNQKPDAAFHAAAPPTTPDIDSDSLPDAWEIANFNSIHGTDPDSDSDGAMDLLEFALGTDPVSATDVPTLSMVPASTESSLEFTYQQIAGGSGDIGTTYTAAGMQYTVEVSSELLSWQNGPEHVTWSGRREPLADGMERVGVYLNGAPTKAFVRLSVTPEP